jgi:hypothetical protein
MRFFGPGGARPRIGTLASAAIACALVLVLPCSAAVAAPDLLPDLVATAPTNPQFDLKQLDDGQTHLLLRFDADLRNIGPGPLEVGGSNPVNGVMQSSWQRIYQDGFYQSGDGDRSTPHRDVTSTHPVIKFESADGHNHWHVQNAARYGLWNEAGTAEVGRAAKVGFCLEDVSQFIPGTPGNSYANPDTSYCNAGMPNAPSVFEGITYGWQDTYVASLPFQWVDISDVAPGPYRLEEQVDPDNLFVEASKANNGPVLAPDIVSVPGWVASSATVTLKKAQTILLGAQRYGNSASAVFTIQSAPKHGKLNVPTGVARPGFQVVYTPNRGFSGSDAFTFSARDPASAFPLHPPVATVSVKVPRGVGALRKLRLLTKLRFSRNGRFLTVRGRATRNGMLKVQIDKGKRQIGSCTKRARSKHGFRCRIKLRKHASPARAKGIATLRVNGKPTAFDTFRVPRRIGRK